MKRSHIISFVVSLAVLIFAFPRAEELLGAQRAASPWFYVTLASVLVFGVSLLLLLEDIFPWLHPETEKMTISEPNVPERGESKATLRTRYEGLPREELHAILDDPIYSQAAQEVAIEILRGREQTCCPCSGTCSCEIFPPPPGDADYRHPVQRN